MIQSKVLHDILTTGTKGFGVFFNKTPNGNEGIMRSSVIAFLANFTTSLYQLTDLNYS
jgi:hypothetical protein